MTNHSRPIGTATAIDPTTVVNVPYNTVILGATDERAPVGMAPLAIGLCLTLIHLISVPVTNTSVNPARSTGPALFAGAWALEQLWLFWLAPIAGAIISGFAYRSLFASAQPAREADLKAA